MDFLLTLLVLIGIVDGLLLGFLLLAIIHAANKVGAAATAAKPYSSDSA